MTIDTTAPADTAEKSLREELQASYDAATADDGGADDSGAGTGGTGSAAGEARTRDAHGRFAGKQEATDATIVDRTGHATGKPAAPVAPPAAATGQVAGEQQQGAAPPAAPAAAPGNLKPELRAAWDAADPALRQWINAREVEVHKGFTRMDEERQYGRSLRQVIDPYMPLIQSQGSDAVKTVQALLNTAYVFTAGTPQQKVAALHQVATQYGIPLEHLFQHAQGQPRVDPNVAALQQQVQQLTQSRQQEQAEAERHQQYQLQTEIAAFAAAPGHEHFEQVKTYMGSLLTNGHAKDLQDAYEQAVWARPDLRQTVLAAQQQTAQQAQATQAQARAEAARKAAGSVAGSPGTSVPVKAPDRSLREELRANFRAAQH
jgi:hypothetical protein